MERTVGMGVVEVPPVDRMLVKTASLKINTSAVAEVTEKAIEITAEEGGYVETSSMTEGEKATLKLRIPAPRLGEVLDRLADLGTEVRRQISARDVTDQVTDLEATLKSKIALRDRLRKLLERAITVRDVIEIEQQLTRLQAEVDSMEGRLNNLKTQVALASITLTIGRKRILGPLGYLGAGLWWLVSKLFVIQ